MRRSLLTLLLCFAALPTLKGAAPLTLPLWPGTAIKGWEIAPGEHDTTTAKDDLVAGKRVARITGITWPTMTVYPPKSHNTGAAALVFPGGGYRILAYDLEGTEVCDWLNSAGLTCLLVKYRVPAKGRYPEDKMDLADAQAAMHLAHLHAAEWHIDGARIGVIGFSAGGHLAAVLSNHAEESINGKEGSDRPAFAMLIYPAYLRTEPDGKTLSTAVTPNAKTPPTFLLQAEDDPVHEENAWLYFQALKEAHIPAELHLFAAGRHGYGLRRTALPVTHWPDYAQTWLHTIGILR